jgi:hypothetical protein
MYPCNQGLPGAARQRTVRCVHAQQQPGNGLPYEEHSHAHAGCSRTAPRIQPAQVVCGDMNTHATKEAIKRLGYAVGVKGLGCKGLAC